jgi:hypothetical protein
MRRRITVNRHLLLTVVAAALAWCPLMLHAAKKSWFGVALSIDTEGVSLNPRLRSVKVEKIFPFSPAAKSDLAQGDVVHGADVPHEVALIAVSKPPGQ